MKVDQKNPTNPNMPSFHLSHAPSMMNMELPSPDRLSDKSKDPGNIVRYSPAPSDTCSTALDYP